MFEFAKTCVVCETKQTSRDSGNFWSLSNYFGLSGSFCGKCYDKVSHDSYGEPEHPGEYMAILLKIGKFK